MKIELRGIHPVRSRLADGTIRTHHYLGRKQHAPKIEGKPDTPEFIESYKQAKEKRKSDQRTTDSLIDDYFESLPT